MKNEDSTAPLQLFPDGEHPFYIQRLLGYPGDCSGWGQPRMLSEVLGEVKSLGRLVGAQPTHSEGIQPQEQPGSQPRRNPGTGGQGAGPGRRPVTGTRYRDSGAAARDASATPLGQTRFTASNWLITGHQ